jgi:hypothetical protein
LHYVNNWQQQAIKLSRPGLPEKTNNGLLVQPLLFYGGANFVAHGAMSFLSLNPSSISPLYIYNPLYAGVIRGTSFTSASSGEAGGGVNVA